MTLPLFGAPQEQLTRDDYYTPEWVFEELDLRFDLDVAAPPGGVSYLPADRFFTKADDGLAQPWVGRVWMNPPYSESTAWAIRFRDHGNGVALLPFAKANWAFDLWASDAAVALLPTRTKFMSTDAGSLSIFMPVSLWAFGVECVEAIGRVGHVR